MILLKFDLYPSFSLRDLFHHFSLNFLLFYDGPSAYIAESWLGHRSTAFICKRLVSSRLWPEFMTPEPGTEFWLPEKESPKIQQIRIQLWSCFLDCQHNLWMFVCFDCTNMHAWCGMEGDGIVLRIFTFPLTCLFQQFFAIAKLENTSSYKFKKNSVVWLGRCNPLWRGLMKTPTFQRKD